MSETEKKLSIEIKELRQRLDEPDSKTVELSSSGVSQSRDIYDSDETHHTPGILAMANFLKNMKR